MGMFASIAPKKPEKQPLPEPAAPKATPAGEIVSMVKRIEARVAIALGCEDGWQPEWQVIDPMYEYSPEDSDLWFILCVKAKKISEDFYARLYFMRGGGSRLVPDQKWGYVIQPILSIHGWESLEQYQEEKKCLLPYAKELTTLLRKLADDEMFDAEKRKQRGSANAGERRKPD